MPYKWKGYHLSEKQDRRVKLTSKTKEEIRNQYSTGMYSLRQLARKYNVCHKTILLIVNPNSKEVSDEYIKTHWRFYYDKERHNKAVKNTRDYKKRMYEKGELKNG